MKNILIVIDMQKDFVSGVLGTSQAQSILCDVKDYIQSFEGEVFFTLDTHLQNYMDTAEGKKLPVPHCIKGTDGHTLEDCLIPLSVNANVIEKPTFGSLELAKRLCELDSKEKIGKITLIGVCTDICVISNALCIKAALPETQISVVSRLCAGTTPQNHSNALSAMEMCQIDIE